MTRAVVRAAWDAILDVSRDTVRGPVNTIPPQAAPPAPASVAPLQAVPAAETAIIPAAASNDVSNFRTMSRESRASTVRRMDAAKVLHSSLTAHERVALG